ncbi:hypothetical protein SK667_1034 [Streptococcus mitis]|nr:hypothetical protein SK667_1034 [Streptococcus mitis]
MEKANQNLIYHFLFHYLFVTHIYKVLVQANIISQFWMKRSYQHIFSWAATI